MCRMSTKKAIKLNLGCGLRKMGKGFINIDNRPEVKPDSVHDIIEGLPYEDNSVDEIMAVDFLEHLERHEVLNLMDEIWRVLKHGGKFQHRTPSSDGRGAFQDPYHKSFWNINTWRYYFTDPLYRELYGTKANFNIVYLEDIWIEDKVLDTHCIYEAIKTTKKLRIMLGCIYNDIRKFERILKRSVLESMVIFAKYNTESATKGLNIALDNIEKEDGDIAILAHQDIFFPAGWQRQFTEEILKLPDSWIVAGICGKDMTERYCGSLYDRRLPGLTVTEPQLPIQAISLDECCIAVNMKSGFRFDEGLEGFHLYGTYAALRAQEMGTAWVIDCPPEHYTKKPFDWKPDNEFMRGWEWLKKRFPNRRICSVVYREIKCNFEKLANIYDGQAVWIIGKGPSLQYLKKSDIGKGPVIALNLAIIKIEQIGLTNPIFSIQKDMPKGKECSMNIEISRDCDKCDLKVRPKNATLLVQDSSSRNCFVDYSPRYVFDWEELGLPYDDFSMGIATELAKKMGCTKFNFVSCDLHTTGSKEKACVPGFDTPGPMHTRQGIESIKPYIEGLDCEWITPNN